MISKICGASNHFHQVGLITVHQPFLALFLRSKDSVLVLNHWIFHLHLAYIHLTPSTRLKYTLWLFLPTMPLANEGLYPNPPIFPNHPTANSLGTSLPNLLDFISSLTVTAKKGTRSAFHKHNRWPTGHLPPPPIPATRIGIFFSGRVTCEFMVVNPPNWVYLWSQKVSNPWSSMKNIPPKRKNRRNSVPIENGTTCYKKDISSSFKNHQFLGDMFVFREVHVFQLNPWAHFSWGDGFLLFRHGLFCDSPVPRGKKNESHCFFGMSAVEHHGETATRYRNDPN